ncbi:MAG: tetratricopeptide repeat protein [Saprospiraceae bacterium]|nr:tetratricopeptide repeat protein [Saprospiraceae bacterium]
MKNLIKFCLPLFLLASLFSSCMKSTSLTVLQPAQMTLPEHITTVAVVDRSKPSNGWLNVLEGLFTGEAIGQDKRSREEAVRGLTDALTRTPRFSVKNTGIELPGSKAGNNLPAPLEWREVERICAEYGAHAVVTIESFDSDNSSSARRVETKRKGKDGKQYIDVRYQAQQRTGVRIGWRLYDPRTKIIVDEYTTDDYLEKTASGSTERNAINNLPSQVSVTRSVAFSVGHEYGARIAPLYVQVARQYYHKAKGYKPEMKQAAAYLRSKEYERAAAIWKKIEATAGENQKAAGRAAYNMAVIAELNGNLDLALDWAKKGWSSYGNKKARNYIQVIEMRQNDVRKVESQMPKKKV